MKKYLSILFVAIIILTGCAKKSTLSCSKGSDGSKAEMTFTFKDDKVTKVVYKEEMASKEEAKSYAALYTSIMGSSSLTSAKADGKYFVLKMSGKALEDTEYLGSKDELKKKFETDGYKCE